jgi:hypothetical protein
MSLTHTPSDVATIVLSSAGPVKFFPHHVEVTWSTRWETLSDTINA